MKTTTTFVAALVLPLLLLACDRAEQSPTAAVPSQEKQATTTPSTSPDQTLERAPPAAGMPGAPAGEPAATPAPQSDTPSSPATQPESRKAY